MKKCLFLILSFLIVTIANASSSVTVFSNTGLRFWVIVNGEKINKMASERVVFDKNAGTYKLRIIIKNQPTEAIDDSEIFLIDVADNYNYLFEVYSGFGIKKTVALTPYKFVNLEFVSGKWKLKINNSTRNVVIKVLLDDELSEYAELIMSDEITGNVLCQGSLKRRTNIITIRDWTNDFYESTKNSIRINLNCVCKLTSITMGNLNLYFSDNMYDSISSYIYFTYSLKGGHTGNDKIEASISLSK